MSRIPDRLLEHTVILFGRRAIPSSSGEKFFPPVTTKSITIDGAEKVIDDREETRGQEIISKSHVLVQPEFLVPPGSLMVIWPESSMERKLTITTTAFGKHSIAWESAQFWGV